MAEPIRLQGAPLDDDFRPSYRPEKTAGGFDPEHWRIGLMAAGLGAGIALLIGASTLLGHAHHGLPVVEADAGPVRVKPLDPGGMKVTGADIGPGTGGGGPQLAPAAEQPEINALKAQLLQVKRQLARQAAANAQAARVAAEKTEAAKLAMLAPAPKAAAKTGPVPVPPVEQATARITLPAPVATAAPAATAPVKIVASARPVVATGTQVQLAAFGDEAAARTAWAALSHQAPDLIRGHKPDIIRVQADGHPMWRLRTGGFTTVAQAASFCSRVHARGGACSIAAF